MVMVNFMNLVKLKIIKEVWLRLAQFSISEMACPVSRAMRTLGGVVNVTMEYKINKFRASWQNIFMVTAMSINEKELKFA